jgi:hypothetical protein
LLTHECVLKGEGLRKEILNKTHHSPYTIHLESIKMYKDEERSGLEFNTYLSSSSLQATFGCRMYKDEERSGLEFSTYLSSSSLQVTFGCRFTRKKTTLGPEMIQALTIEQRMSAS